MKNRVKNLWGLVVRYVLLLVISLWILFYDHLYLWLSKLSIKSLVWLLGFFYDVNALETGYIINNLRIELIPACMGVSAYLLLVILNLATPMGIKQRIYGLLFSMGVLFIVNIIRIFLMTIMLVNEVVYFDLVHLAIWYVFSILIVIGIWFVGTWLFNIKDIPGYSDIKYLMSIRAK